MEMNLRALLELLNDNKMIRKKISESAKEISKLLNWENIARNYLTIYEETIV